MQLDKQLLVSDGQVLAATANSTDHVNGSALRNLGSGTPLKPFVHIGSPVTGAAPTLAVNLVGADDAAFAVNKITISSLPAFTPVASTIKHLGWPPHAPKQYYRYEYTVGGTTPSIPVTGGFALDVPTTPGTVS